MNQRYAQNKKELEKPEEVCSGIISKELGDV
jgi:hypothetical protein